MKYIIVETTFDKLEEAKELAKLLLNEGLAACVEVIPVESLYKWKGEIEEAKEFVVRIKTKKKLYSQLESVVLAFHSYDLPQIFALPIIKGSKAYLKWIDKETE